MTQKKENCKSVSPASCWIRFQLNLRKIRLQAVAEKANRSVPLVSQVISGVKNSESVGKALAEMLGYNDYKELMEDAFKQTKRNKEQFYPCYVGSNTPTNGRKTV